MALYYRMTISCILFLPHCSGIFDPCFELNNNYQIKYDVYGVQPCFKSIYNKSVLPQKEKKGVFVNIHPNIKRERQLWKWNYGHSNWISIFVFKIMKNWYFSNHSKRYVSVMNWFVEHEKKTVVTKNVHADFHFRKGKDIFLLPLLSST